MSVRLSRICPAYSSCLGNSWREFTPGGADLKGCFARDGDEFWVGSRVPLPSTFPGRRAIPACTPLEAPDRFTQSARVSVHLSPMRTSGSLGFLTVLCLVLGILAIACGEPQPGFDTSQTSTSTTQSEANSPSGPPECRWPGRPNCEPVGTTITVVEYNHLGDPGCFQTVKYDEQGPSAFVTLTCR